VSGGARKFRLPKRVEMAYDLFADKVVATHSKAFKAELAPASTALCFTSMASQVQSLL
jgi:hypothetical protein